MWITDPKTIRKSSTLTFFTIGFIIASVKLIVSGISINTGSGETAFSLTFPSFSGVDFATVVASLGAIYGYRKYTDAKNPERGIGE